MSRSTRRSQKSFPVLRRRPLSQALARSQPALREGRSDTLYDQLAQHAVLMLAAVSILLFVGWWLFAGNGGEESSVPAEPPVVTRATESPASPEPPVSPEPDAVVEHVAEPEIASPRYWSHRLTNLPRHPRTRPASRRQSSSRRASAAGSLRATTTDRYWEIGDAIRLAEPWTRGSCTSTPASGRRPASPWSIGGFVRA